MVPAHRGRFRGEVREETVQRVEVLTAGSAAALVEHAVPDVRPPVRERERPRVRRVRPARVLDGQRMRIGRGAGVAAEGDGRRGRPCRRRAQQAADRRVGAVGTDDGARLDLPVQHDPVRRHLERPDPMAAQLHPAGHSHLDQRRVEHRARDHPARPPARPVDRPAVRGAQAQPRHRWRQIDGVRDAERGEQVEHLRGDPVAAALVPRERGRVEQDDPAPRPLPQDPQRRGASRRPGADDGDVMHHSAAPLRREEFSPVDGSVACSWTFMPDSARWGVPPPATRSAFSTAACQTS